ncbi:hypothetical protein DFA_03344 [Cavenderia fasciculata]|uniref:Ankyrin repeat-containing protein n=1 Tax=Cavenderia fasciculata TaxID=261658 RepID=F4PHB4_CACFS|nr:uncharacterized protein DFA_03344 [Cavenderia fasciculata]EGG25098.1 hypothetical protein DFA_03344 [Cavenderia fasciculata]|eukprot:XP_004362949.1 hypothetical protein DFA_03344 [Cavenderia fasciculata]
MINNDEVQLLLTSTFFKVFKNKYLFYQLFNAVKEVHELIEPVSSLYTNRYSFQDATITWVSYNRFYRLLNDILRYCPQTIINTQNPYTDLSALLTNPELTEPDFFKIVDLCVKEKTLSPYISIVLEYLAGNRFYYNPPNSPSRFIRACHYLREQSKDILAANLLYTNRIIKTVVISSNYEIFQYVLESLGPKNAHLRDLLEVASILPPSPDNQLILRYILDCSDKRYLSYRNINFFKTVAIGNVAALEMLDRRMKIPSLQDHHSMNCGGISPKTMEVACLFGRLDVVKFLHYNRSELGTNKCLALAAVSNNPELIKFLHTNRSDCGSLSSVVPYILQRSKLEEDMKKLDKKTRFSHFSNHRIDYSNYLEYNQKNSDYFAYLYYAQSFDNIFNFGSTNSTVFEHYLQKEAFVGLWRDMLRDGYIKHQIDEKKKQKIISDRKEIIQYLQDNNVINQTTIPNINSYPINNDPKVKYFGAENSFINMFNLYKGPIPKVQFNQDILVIE